MQKHTSLFEVVQKYIVASIILAIPLYPKFPLFDVPGTYVSVRLEDFLILTAMILFFVMHLKDLRSYLKDRVFIVITLFVFVGLLSYISGVLVTNTINWQIGLLHWVRRIEYLSVFFVGFFAIRRNPENLNFYLKLIAIVISLVVVYGLGQRYLYWPIVITQNEEYSKGVALRFVEGSHINSTFAGHYDLATYLVFTLPLILALMVYFKKLNFTYLPVYFGGLWLLVNTASRISLVSFIMSSSVALILLQKFKRGFIFIIISVLFIGFSSNLIGRYERVIQIFGNTLRKYAFFVQIVNANDVVIERREKEEPTPTPLPVFEDRSTSIRLNVEWPRALRAFTKNPLLGTGYSSITLATDNDYLRLLGETGILGFSSFILILISILLPTFAYVRSKYKDSIQPVFVVSILGGFIGMLINALFIDIFEASKIAITFWLFFGMMYSVVLERKLYE